MCLREQAHEWEKLSYAEKNYELYIKQKKLLELFLEKGAISRQQHDKSLHDLNKGMQPGLDKAKENMEKASQIMEQMGFPWK